MLWNMNTLGQIKTLKNIQSQSQLEYRNQDRAALIPEADFLPFSRFCRILKLSLQDQAVIMANSAITILKQKNFVLENSVIRSFQLQKHQEKFPGGKLPESSSHRTEITSSSFLFFFFKLLSSRQRWNQCTVNAR